MISIIETITINQLTNLVVDRRLQMRKIQQGKIYHRYWNDNEYRKKDLDILDDMFVEQKG